MASATLPVQPITPARSATLAPAKTTIPWYLWSLVLAVVLVTVGGQADVSWHRSIGRDSFWTPPHMMVYACGLLAGVSCAYLILATTFGTRKEFKQHSVHFFGLRAPTGVFLTAWGGLAMLFSSPFDNWWHNAYGLDVQVQSPPHIVLLAGTWAVCQGTLLVCAAHMNRTRAEGRQQTGPYLRLFLLVGALSVIHLMSYSMSYTFDTRLHAWKPYLVMSTGVPFTLAALAATVRKRPGSRDWTATTITGLYTAFMLALVWGLPFIPAHPRLGPVFQPITHLIPPKFPILLLVPAVALDLLWQRTGHLSRNLVAILSGPLWLALLVAAEWPFATFLMTPHALGPFFATGPGYLDFGTPAANADALRLFESPVTGPHLYAGLAAAIVIAIVMVRAGQAFGTWMREIYR